MLKTTLKDLWAKKIRLVTTSVAVLLGVAFMSGTLVLTDTVSRTFNELFESVNKGTDEYVRAEEAIQGDEFAGAQRPRVDDSLVATVAAVDGVAIARGNILKNGVQIVGRDGKAIGNPGNGPPTFGGEWSDDQLNPYTLAEGAVPVREDEVVIDRKSAKEGKLAVGDHATILTPEPLAVTIVGIATFGSTDSAGGSTFVGMIEASAQRWFAEPGKFDAVGVVAEDGVSQETLRDRIAAVLPPGHEVITGKQLTKENQDDIQQGLGFFKNFLLVFAYIALFVGSFIIYNTFGIIVAQRTRELALLRSLGASRRQVLRSVLIEAALVGAVAGGLGLVVGIGVAGLLKAILDAAGLDVPAGNLVVGSGTVITSFAVGIIVSVASAYFPARKASKVPPLAAMRAVAFERTTPTRARVVAGVVTVALGVVALFSGLFTEGSGALARVGLGALLTFVGVTILGPVLASPIARVLGAPLPRFKGMTGQLARENALRNPKRTATTAAALMIGVALIGFITVFASSAKASLNHLVDDRFRADVIVNAGGFGGNGVSSELATNLRSLPEVAQVASVRIAPVEVDGSGGAMYALTTGAIDAVYDLGVVAGDVTAVGVDGIAVQEDFAEAKGWTLGDTVGVQFVNGGVQQVEVRAIFTDKVLASSYLMSTEAFDLHAPDQTDFLVFLSLADGVSGDDGRAAVEKAAEPYTTATIQDITDFKESQAQVFNMLLTLVYGLLLLAIIIALIGIANTLALSVFERTREIGVLRAIGMSRRQLRSVIRWESVLIALVGTTLGLVLGLFFGWAMSRAMRSEGFTQFSVPIVQLIVITIIAGVAGVVAAWWPARRAAKLNVLAAIAAEG